MSHLASVTLASIKQKAEQRPDGYERDLLDHAEYVDEINAYFKHEVLAELAKKYGGDRAKPTPVIRRTVEVTPVAQLPSWWPAWQELQDPEASRFSSQALAELHAAFREELTPGGKACASCQRAAIFRKYQRLVQDLSPQ